mgnify:CR=1 FL=1
MKQYKNNKTTKQQKNNNNKLEEVELVGSSTTLEIPETTKTFLA